MVYLSEAVNYGGFYFVYIKMAEPFTNYETQMNAFNAAAASFLADINQDASDYEIVRQIHDKLINLVNYNDPVGDGDVEWDRGQDLAHTAYGCLVADSSGNPNYAVATATRWPWNISCSSAGSRRRLSAEWQAPHRQMPEAMPGTS